MCSIRWDAHRADQWIELLFNTINTYVGINSVCLSGAGAN